MTIKFRDGDEPPVDVLVATEDYLRETAETLVRAVQDLRANRTSDIKAAQQSVRDVRALFQMVMDERTRVEKLRKQVAGVVHGHALDFDGARDEIGRRLARLRDAGTG
jgi:UDP-2,3-diacylglucosamine pyrophosphatase LpxH